MSKVDELRALRERSVTKPVTKPPAVTKPLAAFTAAELHEQMMAKATLAGKPLGGRPPIGERAMTDAERQRRRRDRIARGK